jgi:tRNA (mo5U34)-methyltransferase
MDALAETLARYPRWGAYASPGQAPKVDPGAPREDNRLAQRERYFLDPLIELCGGDLKGRRVLDLACARGWWSLGAIRAGADYVYGVEGRAKRVQWANGVFSRFGVDRRRYRFEERNVFDIDNAEEFDVVLCLGLLYHVAKPFELLERIGRWNSDLLVIDTSVNRYPGSLFELHHEDPADPRNSVDYGLVVSPSKRAVVEIGNELGYEVATLRPRFTSWVGCRDYRNGTRRAFICAKRTPLTGLDIDSQRPIRDALAWVGRVAGRTFVKRRQPVRRAVSLHQRPK